jgi:hypothetical protein
MFSHSNASNKLNIDNYLKINVWNLRLTQINEIQIK